MLQAGKPCVPFVNEFTPNAVIEAMERGPLVCVGSRGLLDFTQDTFGRATSSLDIYAQKELRSAEGKGPHFDVYSSYLDDKFPFIAIYNALSYARVRTALLPPDFTQVYQSRYGEDHGTRAAYEARRHFASMTLDAAGVVVSEAELQPGAGLFLPQSPGRHYVHEVIPNDSEDPGAYVKLLVPNKLSHRSSTINTLAKQGFVSLDELVTPAVFNVKELRDVFVPREFRSVDDFDETRGGIIIDDDVDDGALD